MIAPTDNVIHRGPVSYTHLDVYKRQPFMLTENPSKIAYMLIVINFRSLLQATCHIL